MGQEAPKIDTKKTPELVPANDNEKTNEELEHRARMDFVADSIAKQVDKEYNKAPEPAAIEISAPAPEKEEDLNELITKLIATLPDKDLFNLGGMVSDWQRGISAEDFETKVYGFLSREREHEMKEYLKTTNYKERKDIAQPILAQIEKLKQERITRLDAAVKEAASDYSRPQAPKEKARNGGFSYRDRGTDTTPLDASSKQNNKKGWLKDAWSWLWRGNKK